MEARHVFAILVLFLTIGFGIILGSSTREEIKANWSEHRCDAAVMLAGFMFKPDDDKRSAFEFSADNLNFCIGSLTSDYLDTIFAKLFEVMQKQIGASSVMTNIMNSLRSGLKDIYGPFSNLMNRFWNKFQQIGSLSSRIFQHLYMAMKKAAGTAIASMYMAIALQTSFLNGIDLVIKIIMIVLYIMLAFAVIFFLPLLPVMIFVLMATGGIEGAFPGRTGGMGSIFCFAPDTPVIMANYDCPIKDVKVGQVLSNGAVVEAVIELPGSYDPLYKIYDIYVSGGHRIWSHQAKKFISVKDHPDAVETHRKVPALWTLITSSREIPIRGTHGLVRFADWEELPDTDEYAAEWDTIARSFLNPGSARRSKVRPYVPFVPPCLDKSLLVHKNQCGIIPLVNIKRGDWIKGKDGWTQVLGICEREVYGGIGLKHARITDGVWIEQENGTWQHPIGTLDDWKWQGMQLVTDSGSFYVKNQHGGDWFLVRDFTEVGYQNLSECYVREDEALEKKLGLDKKSK